jgi:hypothetical protein
MIVSWQRGLDEDEPKWEQCTLMLRPGRGSDHSTSHFQSDHRFENPESRFPKTPAGP